MSNLSIATNVNNDIYLDSNGNLAMATDVDAVQQDCEHALKAQFGEMWLQPTDGMPTLSDIWLTQNFIKWEAAARAKLASIPGVVRVVSFNMTTDNVDKFFYTTEILTVYSDTLVAVNGKLDA